MAVVLTDALDPVAYVETDGVIPSNVSVLLNLTVPVNTGAQGSLNSCAQTQAKGC